MTSLHAHKAWKFGDNIDTDLIIPARYLNSSDPQELAKHCLEDADATFASKVQDGEIIVGGKNFGCGSSREHAPLAIKTAGVSCVIAASFARIFFRNALNIGLPILESAEAAADISNGDELKIDFANGLITNLTKNKTYTTTPFPEFMQQLIACGGLVEYVKHKLNSR